MIGRCLKFEMVDSCDYWMARNKVSVDQLSRAMMGDDGEGDIDVERLCAVFGASISRRIGRFVFFCLSMNECAKRMEMDGFFVYL